MTAALKPIHETLRDLARGLGLHREPIEELDVSTPEKFNNVLIQIKKLPIEELSRLQVVFNKIHEQAIAPGSDGPSGPERLFLVCAGVLEGIKSLIQKLAPKTKTILEALLPQIIINPGLLDKLIKELSTVHGPVREASSLTDDLGKVYKFFDEETPEVIKSVVNGIIRTDPTGENLEKAHDIIKSEIKKLKNPLRRELLQYLVLMPIQEKLGRINPVTVDRAKKNQLLSDFKRLKVDKETQQKYTERTMEEGLSKGAPSKQIKHLSGMLQKRAHLLIRILH